MKTLHASQAALVARSSVDPIWLIRVTPWSDKGAGQLGESIYLSNRSCWYNYDLSGAGNFFRPWVASLGNITTSMTHLASGQGSGVSVRSLDVVLNNSPADNTRVAGVLETHMMEGAQIEIAELLLDIHDTAPLDLMTSHDGTERTVKFRGTVTRVLVNNQAVTLECSSTLPRANWVTITDASTTRPRDVGARFPIPYGKDVIIPLVGYDVSWSTSITTSIPKGDSTPYTGTFGITDGRGFPSSFNAVIGSEVLTLSKTSDTVIDITLRAQAGTQEQPHTTGMPVSEVRNGSKWIVSRYPIAGMKSIYYRNTLDGKLVRIPTGYTFNIQDTSVISGEAVSTLEFSSQQQYDLAEFIATQQYEPTSTVTFSTATTSPQASGTTLGPAGWDGDDATAETYTATSNFAETFRYDVRFTANEEMTAQTIRLKLGLLDDVFWLRVHKGHSNGGEILLELEEGEPLGWHEFTTEPTEDDFRIRFQLKGKLTGTKDIDIYEIEREETEQDAPAGYEVPTEIAAATLSLDLELYAKVDGVASPGGDVAEYDEGLAYNYEDGDGTTWVNSDSIGSWGFPSGDTGYPIGTQSRMLVVDTNFNAPFVGGTDSWSFTNCSDVRSPTSSSSFHFQATSSSSQSTATLYKPAGFGVDLTDDVNGEGHIAFRLFWNGSPASEPSVSNPLIIRIGKGNDVDWDEFQFDEWEVGDGVFTDYLGLGVIARDQTPDAIKGSGWDYTDFDFIEISWKSDAILKFSLAPFEGREKFWTQCNALGGLDFTSTLSRYDVWAQAEYAFANNKSSHRASGPLDMHVYISDDNTVTGTNLPTDYNKYTYSTNGSGSQVFEKFSWSGSSTEGAGVVDITDINYIRIEFAYASLRTGGPPTYVNNGSTISYFVSGLGSRDADIVVKFDAILANKGEPPAIPITYSASEGEALEFPTDISLHWLSIVGSVDPAMSTFTDTLTNLGANVLAGDARGWGATWADVLDRIALISRANFVPEEEAGGTVWKMLTADASYEFGASAATLTLFPADGVSIGGRDEGVELASGRTTLYGYRPHLGNNDEAFTKVIRIGPDQNDSGGNVSAGTVTTALEQIGYVDGPIELIAGIDDEATMQDVASWRYIEGARLAPVVVVEGLSWTDGYSLEVGDIVSLTLPWGTTALKLRLIEHDEDTTEHLFEIRGVEVA